MSTSDSDYSIDWLASDEDDCDGPRRAEAPPAPLSPSASCREPPTNLHLSAARRRSGGCCDCKDGAAAAAARKTSAVSPVQGFTSVFKQHTLSVESKRNATRKGVVDTESELFSHKRAELQCYVQPLSSILRGLSSGRYSERLSSFQESVAMDRIQRILGVLQNPDLGGRFLHIIVKIEEMLRSWFPHVKPDPTPDGAPAKRSKLNISSSSSSASPHPSESSTPPRWPPTSPVCAPVPSPAGCGQEVTQDSAVSSSTDWLAAGPRCLGARPRVRQVPLPFKISLPCLERLLQAKESIIAPRTVGGRGWSS